MNRTMILDILVAYKAFNDKSLTIRINKGEGEYVVNKAIIDNIDGDNISVYGETINLDDVIGIQFQNNMSVDIIDYEDIYDDINDYEYPYNYINHNDLVEH